MSQVISIVLIHSGRFYMQGTITSLHQFGIMFQFVAQFQFPVVQAFTVQFRQFLVLQFGKTVASNFQSAFYGAIGTLIVDICRPSFGTRGVSTRELPNVRNNARFLCTHRAIPLCRQIGQSRSHFDAARFELVFSPKTYA
jgi:hypothetical protein